jgi:hypothetical protein
MRKKVLMTCARSFGVALAAYFSWIDVGLSTPRDTAFQIFNRLNGVPPSAERLDQLEAMVASGDVRGAALAAINDPKGMFYNVTLKDIVSRWTNPDKSPRVPLNDFTATVIGIVRDGIPFNQVFSADILYTGNTTGAPAYSLLNNTHYQFLETQGAPLHTALVKQTQAQQTGALPAAAISGIFSTRGFGDAYFNAGTNRRALAFTFENFLCKSFDTLQDTTRPDFRVRRDVTRAPGGDSSLFRNRCAGCHSGMDGLGGAFAYYDFSATGALVYTANQVQPKMNRNATEFPDGYVTLDDSWINLWTQGPNASLGWVGASEGKGAKSFGEMLAATDAFAHCMAQKAVEALCIRPVENTIDKDAVDTIAKSFKQNNYDLKGVYADAAVHCSK